MLRDYIELTRTISETRLSYLWGIDMHAYIKAHEMRARLHDEILGHVGVTRDNAEFATWLGVKVSMALHLPHCKSPWPE